ncbi:hypothetical protein MPER_04687, partial [Moniliophthora perniciosa FA553]
MRQKAAAAVMGRITIKAPQNKAPSSSLPLFPFFQPPCPLPVKDEHASFTLKVAAEMATGVVSRTTDHPLPTHNNVALPTLVESFVAHLHHNQPEIALSLAGPVVHPAAIAISSGIPASALEVSSVHFDMYDRHLIPALVINLSPASEHRDTLDFTSVEGLAYMNHIPQETHYQSTPLEAHNAIKRFTRDNFSFSNGAGVQDMVAFVKVLASVDRRNTSWLLGLTMFKAFLEMLVKGNGLDRIREILRHTEVSQRAGLFNTLSFQRGYFPIFQ